MLKPPEPAMLLLPDRLLAWLAKILVRTAETLFGVTGYWLVLQLAILWLIRTALAVANYWVPCLGRETYLPELCVLPISALYGLLNVALARAADRAFETSGAVADPARFPFMLGNVALRYLVLIFILIALPSQLTLARTAPLEILPNGLVIMLCATYILMVPPRPPTEQRVLVPCERRA